jgi:hypothetical protein
VGLSDRRLGLLIAFGVSAAFWAAVLLLTL